MASISANGSLGHHKFTLSVSESSTSTANNTSTVKYTFQLSPVQTSWAWEQWGSSISYTITINGTKYTGTIPAYDGYATVTLKSGSQTVTHNSDGSKSISYSFSVVDGAGQRYTPGNASASGILALSTIPRATTPTLSASSITVNGSNAVNIVIKPASSTFKHKIRYAFGSLTGLYSGVSIGSGFSAKGDVTVKFTPPTSALNQIPSATSGICTITCYTYTSDGTSVGTKTVKLTFNVPSYTPTATIKLTGNNLLQGTYVAGKSTVTVETTASSSYGATIKSYSSTVNSKVYTSSKFTTAPLLKESNKTIQVTVTDTRGKTYLAKASSAITIHEYFTPRITKFTLERSADDPETVIATISGTIAPVNNANSKSFAVTLNGVTRYVVTDNYSVENATLNFIDISTDRTYTATAKLTDAYTFATKTFALPTVAVTMDFHKSGKGIAFGKVAENENLFESAWQINLVRNEENTDAIYLATRADTNRRIGFGVGKSGTYRGVYDYFFEKWILNANDEAVFVNGIKFDDEAFGDSGWKTVTYDGSFAHYNDIQILQYRRIGKQVYIRGAMKPTIELAKDTAHKAFTLPVGYRPAKLQDFLCQGSGANKWLCEITSAGVVSVARYGVTEFINIPTTAWLPISASFLVD